MRALIFLCAALAALGPSPARADEVPQVRARFAASPPTIDGRLEEPAWLAAPAAGGFLERRPKLGAAPSEATTFSVLYDGEALYFGVRCRQGDPRSIRALSLQRDSGAMFSDDAISIKLDPQSDKRTTLGFVLNPAGAQLDYRGINEAEFRIEFDAVWQGAARRTADGWSAELRIPWATLGVDPRRPPARMGLDLSRDHSARNATYDWALLRPPLGPIAASRYGDLLGLDELPARLKERGARALRGISYAIIPYLLLGYQQIPDRAPVLLTGGLDARVERGDAFSLQLSVNTDFAQVDLDDQRINLGRFGLFFPEKRDFFLRDLELFRFGRAEEAELFQSRRIGLREGQPVPLLDALKLLLRPLPWLRLGLLQALTMPASGQPWSLALVGRAQAELGGGSNLGLMIAHRQSLGDADDRNLVLGVDGALRSAGPLLVTAFALLSLTGARSGPVADAAGGAGAMPAPGAGAEVSWRGLLLRPRLRYSYAHPELRTDLGFFRRVGVHDAQASFAVEPRFSRRGLERLSAVATAGLVADAEGAGDGAVLDYFALASAELHWNVGSSLGAEGQHRDELIRAPFRIGGGTEIPAGRYGMNLLRLWANSPAVWRVSGGLGAAYRDYYGGQLGSLSAALQARPSSLLRAEVGAELSRISFDDERGVRYAATFNGRLAFGFTPRLGLDAFLAWNSALDLIRLQARARYRYAEGSDLFVVFQQDLSGGGQSKLLSLLIKLSFRFPEGLVL